LHYPMEHYTSNCVPVGGTTLQKICNKDDTTHCEVVSLMVKVK